MLDKTGDSVEEEKGYRRGQSWPYISCPERLNVSPTAKPLGGARALARDTLVAALV